ncbi:MAG: CpsB/CapC family capsule biosynthesis tyrosine phosphatase [Miltoncostaeaceae bacterium]
MIDLHTHLLPDIDDGPDWLPESLAMARAAHAGGTRTMVCTPHMIEHYPTEPAAVHETVVSVQAALTEAGLDMTLVPGGEIDIAHLATMSDEDLRLASIGGRRRWLLLEMPYRGWPVDFGGLLDRLEIRGYGVILAHPERADAVQRHPDRMRELLGRGALVQLTAGSFLGEYGPQARRMARTLLSGGMAHFLASDAHGPGPRRGPGLREGLEAAAEAVRAEVAELEWMVQDGPAAVLAGGEVRPPRIGRARRITPDPERPPPRSATDHPPGGRRRGGPGSTPRRPTRS